MLIGPGDMLQKEYIEGGTKKLKDNNAGNDNTDAAHTKTKAPSLKKRITKKNSDKAFTKIRLPLSKLKTLWPVCKNGNNVSDIPEA